MKRSLFRMCFCFLYCISEEKILSSHTSSFNTQNFFRYKKFLLTQKKFFQYTKVLSIQIVTKKSQHKFFSLYQRYSFKIDIVSRKNSNQKEKDTHTRIRRRTESTKSVRNYQKYQKVPKVSESIKSIRKYQKYQKVPKVSKVSGSTKNL